MNRGLLACALAASLTTHLFLAGCDDCCDEEETDIVGRVTLWQERGAARATQSPRAAVLE